MALSVVWDEVELGRRKKKEGKRQKTEIILNVMILSSVTLLLYKSKY
jgi:hypothetical protein